MPLSPPPPVRSRDVAAGAVVLVLAVVAAFGSARHGAFLLWDDDINITANPHLQRLDRAELAWMFTDVGHMRRYVPLTWLQWSLERQLTGLTPYSAHLGNVLLHAANTLLVFALARGVLLRSALAAAWRAAAPPPAATVAAAAGALLWALHPLQVELVAWASGRIHLLAASFLFGTTLAYLQSATSVSDGSRQRWFALAVGGYALSLLTYPLGLSYVAVLVILDFWVLRRRAAPMPGPARAAVWREKGVFLALALLVGGITVVAAHDAGGIWMRPASLAEFGLPARLAQAFYLWAYYAWHPWVSGNLSPVYTTLVSFDPWSAPFLLSACGVTAVTGVLLWQRARWPGALALWLCHLAILAPMLGLNEHPHYPSDRYHYLPAVAWAIGAAFLVLRAWPRPAWRRLALLAAGLAAVLQAARTSAQIGIWSSDETLFRHAIAQLGDDPYRADLYRRLGDASWNRRRPAEAAAWYAEALQADPRDVMTRLRLGQLAETAGRVEEAVAQFRMAIALRPDFPEAHRRLALLLRRTGPPAAAVAALQRAVELSPGDAALRAELAAAQREPSAAPAAPRPN